MSRGSGSNRTGGFLAPVGLADDFFFRDLLTGMAALASVAVNYGA